MKYSFKLLALIFVLLLVSCQEKKEPEGGITLNREISGVVKDNNGKPIEGVVVSDGYTCAVTNSKGEYKLTKDKDAYYVYYSIPADVKVNVKENGHPDFYQKLIFGQAKYDFTLTKQPVEKKFRLLALGDPQVKDATQVNRYKNETAADIKRFAAEHNDMPVYAITLGDIVNNTWNVYPSTVEMLSSNISDVICFQTIGNHDHEFPTDGDLKAQRTYESFMGPVNYSFNRGDCHIISMDDILHQATASASYSGGFRVDQLEWLEQDLSFVDKSKRVILCVHIPMRNIPEVQRTEVLNMLSEFSSACVISGHTHNNVTSYDYTANGKTIHDYITGTTCGAWWYGTICVDGAPNGYGVHEFDGNKLVDHYYKGTNYDRSFQMRAYKVKDVPPFTATVEGQSVFLQYASGITDNMIVVNAWNADASWTLDVYENGVKTGKMTNKSMRDIWAKYYFANYANRTSKSYFNAYHHMYYYTPQNLDAEIEIVATDSKYNKEYRVSKFTTIEPQDLPYGYL